MKQVLQDQQQTPPDEVIRPPRTNVANDEMLAGISFRAPVELKLISLSVQLNVIYCD